MLLDWRGRTPGIIRRCCHYNTMGTHIFHFAAVDNLAF